MSTPRVCRGKCGRSKGVSGSSPTRERMLQARRRRALFDRGLGVEFLAAENADLQGIADDISPGPKAQLFCDAGAVGFDRFDAQEQPPGDFSVGMSLGQEF